jgi:hypothetical protein
MKNFDYSPGPNGNARQFCDKCKLNVDKVELKRIEEEMTVEGNRYLLGAPKRKSEYDPLDILVEGNMPEFESDADRFICTMEIAMFVKKTGITGLEEGIAKFFDILSPTYRVLFLAQQDSQTKERMIQSKYFKRHLKESLKIATS